MPHSTLLTVFLLELCLSIFKIWLLNITWTPVTFRCGGIITENTRTIFRYDRNNTSSGNTTESNLMGIVNETNSNDESIVADNSSDSQISQQHSASREIRPSKMRFWTRIVNGADCPPGECPWQVKATFLSDHDLFLFCNNGIPIYR